MAARATWTGAVTFAGFPIHLTAYALVKSKKAESFTTLSPDEGPVSRVYVDEAGTVIPSAELRKGYKTAAGVVPLAPEVIEQIGEGERTTVINPDRFSRRESVPLHLATGQYRLVPDKKVPGAEGPVGILWNGLAKTGRVLVTEWTRRAGSMPELVAIHADSYGLTATTLPYFTDLADVPEHPFEENDQQAAVFEQFVDTQYETADFNHAAHVDTYMERRKKLIEAALDGKPIAAESAPAKAEPVPDLMAAMQASLAAAGKAKPKAKKPEAIAA